jgi:hypothetical protein
MKKTTTSNASCQPKEVGDSDLTPRADRTRGVKAGRLHSRSGKA